MKKIYISIITFIFILILCIPTYAENNTEITSKACILVESSTGKIIYEKNSKEKMYPASTTKIMTALLALENCKLDDVVTVSDNAIKSISADYATVYLNAGEQLTVEQLLNILLIPSGNVVGNIFAEHISGSNEAFVKLMNKRAKELGCVNTNFTNSYGLHDDNHYSCAYDLYLIAREAMKNDTFREIVKKTSYKLGPTNVYPKDDRFFRTTNELIKPSSKQYYYENAIGIKTGYTSQAKNCLVAAATKDGLEFITVVLGAGTDSKGTSLRYTETKKLFEYAFNNYSMKTLREANDVYKTVEVKNGTKDTKKLDVLVKDKIVALVDRDNIYNTTLPEVSFDENKLKAPITKGDVIGHIKYNVEDITYESDLIASHDVKKSYLKYIIIGIIIVILIILILMLKNYISKNYRRKKSKYTQFRI